MNFFAAAAGRNNAQALPAGRPNAPPAQVSPREAVSAMFHLSRVVVLNIPFQTPRAAAIRQFVTSRLLNNDNQRLFIFRSSTGNTWTTVALTSTSDNPQLTAQPDEVARKVSTILPQSPDVSTVTLLNEAGQQITAEDVNNLAFVELADQAVVPVETAGNANQEITVAQLHQLSRDVYTKVEEVAQDVKRDFLELNTKLDAKLGYIIDVLEGNERSVDPSSRRHVRRIAQIIHEHDEDDNDDNEEADHANDDDDANASDTAVMQLPPNQSDDSENVLNGDPAPVVPGRKKTQANPGSSSSNATPRTRPGSGRAPPVTPVTERAAGKRKKA